MALACGQKRPRLSAGKALAADVGALPGGGRLKSRCPVWELEKGGGLAEVAVMRVDIPLFAIVGMHDWRNWPGPWK